jgi:hypothetical protein
VGDGFQVGRGILFRRAAKRYARCDRRLSEVNLTTGGWATAHSNFCGRAISGTAPAMLEHSVRA